MRRSLLFVLLVCSLGVTKIWSQSTAQINGTVKDQTGAVLPGVEVSVTQTDNGLIRSAITNEVGAYTLANLPIGPYRLEAALPGFRTYVQSGIVLQVGSNPSINAVLRLGQVSDQVEVQADASLVETRSTGIGQVIDNQRVVELPLNGRQAQYLILLTGGATLPPATGNLNSTKNYPTIVISVAGGNAKDLTYNLDGGTHNDPYNNQSYPLAFPDALQEFKIETSALAAQYGQHSAATVNAVTKSGTNEFHGSVFEFVRNGVFNARNAFAAKRDTLKRNQFGGVVGGPIKRNKIFFFGGYQGTLLRSDPANGNAFIPTPAMQAGDFRAFAAPACNGGRQLALRAPFVNDMLPASALSPAALKIMKYYPQTDDPCGKITYGSNSNSDEHIFLGKVDFQLSERHSLFTRYLGAQLYQPSPFSTGGNPLALNNAGIDTLVQSLVLSDTYLVNNSTVNSFRATASRGALDKFQNPSFEPRDVGIDMFDYMKFTVLTAGSLITGSVFAHAGKYYTTTSQFVDDLSIQKGNHQLGFGGNWTHSLNNNEINLNTSGIINFNGAFTGTPLGDFLTGQVNTLTQGNAADLYTRQHYIGAYAQDSWKATPRLTVSFGLRWEPYLPVYLKRGRVSMFDQTRFVQNVRSTVYTKAPAGLYFAGDPGYPGNGVSPKQVDNFMPRVGIAWDPKADGRMTFRAAWGRFYSTIELFYDQAQAYQSPVGNRISVAGVRLDAPYANYPGGNPFPLRIGKNDPFPQAGTYNSYAMDTRPPYVQQWNLSIQKQLGTNWMVSANYLGNNQIHRWFTKELNPGVFGPTATVGNIATRRALVSQNPAEAQYYESVSLTDDGGTSIYNAGIFSVQRRMANNFTILGNYTWSHCISDHGYSNPSNRAADRGDCGGVGASDIRNIVNISAVFQTPQFESRSMRTLASDWQISTIVGLRSGPPVNIASGLDRALTGIGGQRPNQVLADPYLPNKGVYGWLNPAAFANPALGAYGNVGMNSARGPGMVQTDVSLSRMFTVSEGHQLQIRAEAFNIPNHLNPSSPVSTLSSPQFGKVLGDVGLSVGGLATGPGAGGSRVIQLALKYIF